MRPARELPAKRLREIVGAPRARSCGEARSRIEDFLAECQHWALLTKIIDELRTSVPPWLIDAVRGVNGTPADLAMLLGGIVESTMRRAIKPHLHDEFLREVAKAAQGMRMG